MFYLDILLVDFCLILFCGLLVSCAGCLFGVASWFAWGVWCGGFCCAVVLLWGLIWCLCLLICFVGLRSCFGGCCRAFGRVA